MKQVSFFHCCAFFLLMIISVTGFCQRPEINTIKFTRPQSAFKENENYVPVKTGFRLYRHVLYELMFSRDSTILCEILDADEDNVRLKRYVGYFYMNSEWNRIDTVVISPSKLYGIKLRSGNARIGGRRIKLASYQHTMERSFIPVELSPDTAVNPATGKVHIGYVNMTASGPQRKYFSGNDDLERPFIRQLDSVARLRAQKPKIKRGIWFPPAFASEINGLALGLHTGNIVEDINGRPLKINGLNINADILTTFAAMMIWSYSWDGISSKSLDAQQEDASGVNTINGLSISGGGLIDVLVLRGISVNGGICQGDKANGIVVSGILNSIENMNGLAVAGFRNKAINCRGMQIGLINTSKKLRGIQIGLWNVNSRRKLPLINWCFR